MKIIDAHIHINPKCEQPISELFCVMDKNNVEKSVLIINTLEELDAASREKNKLLENSNRFCIVCGLDIHALQPFRIVDEVSDWGVCVDIKLHPLLFHYTREDFEQICRLLSENQTVFRNIIIDTLFNNDFFETHIGVELGIMLAKKFEDKKVILAHAGSIKLLECLAYTRNIPNIFYDISFVATYFKYTHIRQDLISHFKFTSNRIMFGSDFPSFDIKDAKDSVFEILEDAKVPVVNLQNIMYNTAQKVYFS